MKLVQSSQSIGKLHSIFNVYNLCRVCAVSTVNHHLKRERVDKAVEEHVLELSYCAHLAKAQLKIPWKSLLLNVATAECAAHTLYREHPVQTPPT